MKKSILAVILVLLGTLGTAVVFPASASAACAVDGGLLTFRPWYDGLQKKDSCDLKSVVDTVANPDNEDNEIVLNDFIWAIILNVVNDIFQAVAYVAVGFVMWGGFLFMTSTGNPDQAARGRKTLINALIGAVIAMSAGIIVNFFKGVITQ